eukprot:2477887-Alexandrium_andersonii.AAC.1
MPSVHLDRYGRRAPWADRPCVAPLPHLPGSCLDDPHRPAGCRRPRDGRILGQDRRAARRRHGQDAGLATGRLA